MKIAVLLGSTRPGRKGEQVARWVLDQARARDDATYELLDLADFDLDLLDDPTEPGSAGRTYKNPKTQRWSRVVDGYDGFVWVTPEYNRGVPAAMKNAFDVLYLEWGHKAAGIVGYGGLGAARAAEQWRTILLNAQLFSVKRQVALSTSRDFTAGRFTPGERRPAELAAVLTDLTDLSRALRPMRHDG